MLIVAEGFFRNYRWTRIAELKQQLEEMGFDFDAMMYEFGMGEEKEEPQAQPTPQYAQPTPKPAEEEGDLPEPDQSGMRTPADKAPFPPPPPPLTDEQRAKLEETLAEMGLDASAMLYEFGLSASDPAAADRTPSATPAPPRYDEKKDDEADTSADVSGSPAGDTEDDTEDAALSDEELDAVLNGTTLTDEQKAGVKEILLAPGLGAESKTPMLGMLGFGAGTIANILEVLGLGEGVGQGVIPQESTPEQALRDITSLNQLRSWADYWFQSENINSFSVKQRDRLEKMFLNMRNELTMETKRPTYEVVKGVNLYGAMDLVHAEKVEMSKNRTHEYPLGYDPNTDPSLRPPYVNIWNPLETGLSPDGLEFILKWEEKKNYPYDDTTQNCTGGYGRMLHEDKCTEEEKRRFIDDAKILDWLVEDILETEKYVRDQLQKLDNKFRKDEPEGNPVPLSQEQFDTLVSLVYNIGIGNFQDDLIPLVVKQNESGEVVWDEGEFRSYMLGKASEGGAGLRKRREQELELFYDGNYGEGP